MNQTADHAALMDRIYRYQRFVYDLSRKYYLLGRDALIQEMDVKPGDHVLEMGCGTARNLILLAKLRPDATLYGIDASQEMLNTAQIKVDRAGLTDRIILKHALAEDVEYGKTFGLDRPFDAVFFSYSLSMIPTWKQAVQTALKNLKPGGTVYIVDFWDQGGWPGWFQGMLKGWLALFHVRHEPELLDYLKTFENAGADRIQIDSIFRRYAFKTRLRKETPSA
ncbi:MAG: methyltransferase domain-containing protein [bacterium]|nr:methyltransferase domain-containing protein [bacterium]